MKKQTTTKRPTMKESAAQNREKFKAKPKVWEKILEDFPPESEVQGEPKPLTESDAEKLTATLKALEDNEDKQAKRYTELREKGVDALEDHWVAYAQDLGQDVARELLASMTALKSTRGNIGSVKARLVQIQGALLEPLKALPPAAGGKRQQQVKEIEWLSVRRSVLEACLMVASKDDVRYYLQAVYLHAIKKDVRLVASNGHTLFAHSSQADAVPDWVEGGLLLPRDLLAVAMAAMAKLKDDDAWVQIGYGRGQQYAFVRDAQQFASFRMAPVDPRFPDYGKILEKAAKVLEGGVREALTATSMQQDYVKQAAAVAAKFAVKGQVSALSAFTGIAEDEPTVWTFGSEPGALLLIMPMRADPGQQMPVQTMKMLGSKALTGSAAALKAHLTRQKNALASAANDSQKSQAKAAISSLESRLAQVQQAIGNQLEGPKKGKAKKEPVAPAPVAEQASAPEEAAKQ